MIITNVLTKKLTDNDIAAFPTMPATAFFLFTISLG